MKLSSRLEKSTEMIEDAFPHRNVRGAQIPFTLHWGKFNFWLNKARVETMYGADTVQKWKDARKALLENDAVRGVFTNKFMEDAGLAD